MTLKASSIFGLNSFILTSIILVFVISLPEFSFLRVYLIIIHFIIFYFFAICRYKKLGNKSIVIITTLVAYILIQNIFLQDSILTIFQALTMTVFLFFASQIGLLEADSFFYKEKYKKLSKALLFLLPFFFISFGSWSDFRKPGLFMNPNITSHLSMMLLPFILLGLDRKRYKIIAIGLVLALITITASRSALMALVLSLLAYLVTIRFPKINFLSLTIIISSVISISIYAVEIAIWIFKNLSSITGASNSRLLYTGYNGRDILLEYAINRFETQPMLGLGFDSTKFNLDGNVLGTHNGLIEILLKFGIIGSIIFIIFCLNLIWMVSKHNAKFKPVAMMSLCAIFSLSTNSSTFFVLNYLFIYVVILVFVGYKLRYECVPRSNVNKLFNNS